MATDANSAKKYFYFIRLMGRAMSHIALEVALQVRTAVVVVAN
jgi:pyrophosphate--fructose-6-phosphate 1-phosphotransferase